jgi:RNA polymerase sigma-70 factor (ECF subfamily)
MKHKIIDYMRKSARERSTVQEISLDDVPENLFDQAGEWAVKPSRWDTDPWKVLEKKEFRDTLMGCLAELPSRMAHVFALREIEQLEGEEVSRVMEISSNNLGVLLHRARHRLRLCLEINWFA